MKSVVIFYFSGTGNTELVSNMVKEELSKRQCTVEIIRIEDVLKNKLTIDFNKYDLIGIGSQVIGFTTPGIVNDFIRILPKVEDKKVFVFRTAGGVAPINYNASKPMMRKLARKGYDVFYERVFSISSNWIKKFDDDIIVKLYEATRKKVGLMCEAVICGGKRILKTSFLQRVLMECVMFVSPIFFRLAGKDYVVDKSCTHCGACIKNCPAGNIVEKNGKIKFKLSCNCCLRCVYSCPNNAIHFRTLSFFTVAEGYNIKKILAQPSICDENKKKPVPPFFNAYLANDAL